MPSQTLDSPWPEQTPVPRKRRRIHKRQALFDQVQQAERDCQLLSDNSKISCFPTEDDVFLQDQFATFVWNSRLPSYAQTNQVDLFLFHGDSNDQVLHIQNHPNPINQLQAGNFQTPVNDSWWGEEGANWNGQNISRPFYWVVIPSTTTLDGSQPTQTHFTAVQTTFPNSILSAMSASSASAASASSASAASASRASSLSAASRSSQSQSQSFGTSSPSPTSGNGNLQPGQDDSGFPQWAIAVIVILGFLAIASSCILAFFIFRRMRRKEYESNRNSMGSSSPMMANVGNSPGSPLLANSGANPDHHSSLGHGAAVVGAANLQRAPSVVSPDGASTVSRAGSAGEGGPFSGADAAIMADAFRKALRKPDFTDPPPDEESPGRDEELLNRELAEEGRDIRSVSSSRGVRVETLSDEGTMQDHSSYQH
ncbi:hypothetical protein K435DRAFT_851487 [Dendrothele bispora CBS 962.96]|uniref:Uncharacterized protein n=1 Tax=Dendrothele bispora (strain CBS 962.96) TaxID=1314807 RepID=A0A4S8MMZ4_DENBC|nr:hypothetical protein K435DRAFT_851487 [Dendrothele bispora CBS 962.96]